MTRDFVTELVEEGTAADPAFPALVEAAEARRQAMSAVDWAAAARRIATAYPLTEAEAATYLAITGREDIATEAGRAHGEGYHHADVRDALLYSEATTAEGIAHWIRTRRRAARS